jgi:hypothetical protein
MLEIGNGAMTKRNTNSEFWAMLAAPLLLEMICEMSP